MCLRLLSSLLSSKEFPASCDLPYPRTEAPPTVSTLGVCIHPSKFVVVLCEIWEFCTRYWARKATRSTAFSQSRKFFATRSTIDFFSHGFSKNFRPHGTPSIFSNGSSKSSSHQGVCSRFKILYVVLYICSFVRRRLT